VFILVYVCKWASLFCIATSRYELGVRRFVVSYPGGAVYFSALKIVQTGSGTHTASYSVSTESSFLGITVGRA
jgi:hypothetical protein